MDQDERAMVVQVLQEIVRNDTTRYEHHETRRWDGLGPETAGGTRWLEPREMARNALRQLGAEIPDSFAEARARAAARRANEGAIL